MGRADSYYPGTKTNRWYPDNLVVAPPTAGNYIFVDGNMSTGGSGNSWADAFSTIQDAVDAAGNGGDVIMVAPKDSDGNYNENVVIGGTTALEYGLVGLHVMGVMNGLKNVRVRAPGASNLQTYSSLSGVSMLGSCFTIMCSSIEISNMCLDASGVYTGIHRTDGGRLTTAKTGQTDCQNSSTHDCVFKYGTTGLNFDGASNDHVVYNNIFYKQTDEGIYIGPGALQQTVRVYVYNNIFNGPEDYGVYMYSTTSTKDHIIGPGNVIKDQLSGTTEVTAPVYSLGDTATCAVVGNYFAVDTDHDMGTLDIGSGNYDGTIGATEKHVSIA